MDESFFQALGWMFAAVTLAYALQRAAVSGLWRWRRQQTWRPVVSLAAVAVLGGILVVLRQPWVTAGLALLTGMLLSGAHMRERAAQDWMAHKDWVELNRQVWLHMALAAGAAVFAVPFLWLLSTSLKYDDQMKAFPPQFIPTKAETVTVNGTQRSVYRLRRASGDEKVTIASRLPGGRARVCAAGGSRAEAGVVALADLHEIRHFRPRWENYSEALEYLPPEYHHGLVPLFNTLYITVLTIIGLLLSSSLGAYAFARLRWPGREAFFVILLATMMLPQAVTMLPVFLIFRWLGWIDTLRPLWVPAFMGSAFNIFLLRQFFMTVPMELEEAAKIDGANPFTTYWRIMLPLVKPALAAVTIFAFMGSWNNFMGPLIYINSPGKMPLSYALFLFQGTHGGEQGMLMAASTLVMLPVLLVFFFTQRYFIQGITLTGLKG